MQIPQTPPLSSTSSSPRAAPDGAKTPSRDDDPPIKESSEIVESVTANGSHSEVPSEEEVKSESKAFNNDDELKELDDEMSEDFVGEEGVGSSSDSKVVEQLTKELSDRCVGFSCNDDSEALKSLVCCAVQSVEGLSGMATNSIFYFSLRFVKDH